jgi:hypothetical protein
MEPTNDVSPIRQQIDEIRGSEAYTDAFHPSHLQALDTISKLYAAEYKEPAAPPPSPEDIERLKADANAVKVEALKVDNPEQAAIEAALQPLKEDWGPAYEANIQAAQGLVEHMTRKLGVEVAEVFDTIGNSPRVIRALYSWSRGEDGGELTVEDAKEVISLLQKTDAYKSGASRTSETVQQIVQALYQIAYQQEK